LAIYWPGIPSGLEEGGITPIVVRNYPNEGGQSPQGNSGRVLVQDSMVVLVRQHHRATNGYPHRTGPHLKPLKLNELRRTTNDYLCYLHLMAYRHPSQIRMHGDQSGQGQRRSEAERSQIFHCRDVLRPMVDSCAGLVIGAAKGQMAEAQPLIPDEKYVERTASRIVGFPFRQISFSELGI
jgi:hypothetical protein